MCLRRHQTPSNAKQEHFPPPPGRPPLEVQVLRASAAALGPHSRHSLCLQNLGPSPPTEFQAGAARSRGSPGAQCLEELVLPIVPAYLSTTCSPPGRCKRLRGSCGRCTHGRPRGPPPRLNPENPRQRQHVGVERALSCNASAGLTCQLTSEVAGDWTTFPSFIVILGVFGMRKGIS
eukprot:scaffold5198_cov247-Pinguiococcus_pyrenoidosus.AAC.15